MHAEHQAQIANHATVRNVITSMRLLSSADWADFFESVSLVHEALCDGHPRGRDGLPDARPVSPRRRGALPGKPRTTSSRWRGARWRMAAAPRRAEDARRPDGADPRLADPGYYLIAQGRPRLEGELEFRVPGRQWLRRAWVRAATPCTSPRSRSRRSSSSRCRSALTALGGRRARRRSSCSRSSRLVPASDLAIALVHRFVTRLVGPRRLPKLELAGGVPAELRTLVAIPMLLTDESEIDEVVQRLEVHYLANADPELRFALLSDWPDAPAESVPEDEDARSSSRAPRSDSSTTGTARRPAAATASGSSTGAASGTRAEGVWMGWERKRGKLRELNRLLRGATDTSFLPPESGAPAAPAGSPLRDHARRRLPPAAGGRAPAGRNDRPPAEPSRASTRPARAVVEGHAILQPRVTPTLPEMGLGTLFQLVFSGPRGIDPYAFAVSDVYQDLFGEGIYTGKGIYDVDAFERALDDRVPENTQLSHDLFEGLFARAGFVSDVELFEGFPGHYEVAVSRQHRWVRGDWQLLPWILGTGPEPSRAPARGRAIPADRALEDDRQPAAQPVGAGDLRDAARRLVPARRRRRASGRPSSWRRSLLPALLSFFSSLLPQRRGVSPSGASSAEWPRTSPSASRRPALRIVFLAHSAWLRADAIARTLWRLGGHAAPPARMGAGRAGAPRARPRDGRLLSADARRRSLLAAAAAGARGGLGLGRMGLGRALPRGLAPVAPASRGGSACLPARPTAARLSAAEARQFRAIARRTWRYFERFAGPEFHDLPADNFQEVPAAGSRAADLADQHRPRPALDGRRQRLRLDRNRRHGATASRRPSPRSGDSSASAATSTTGTTRTTSRRSSPVTSPRSTAATSPRT